MTNLAHKSGGLVMKSGGLGTSCGCCCDTDICYRLNQGESADDLFSATECTVTDTVVGGTFTTYLFSYFFTECSLTTGDCPLLVRGEWSFTNASKVNGNQFGCISAGGSLDATICTPASGVEPYCQAECNGSDIMWYVQTCAGATAFDYSVTFTVRARL